ncbi:FxSxx-COOH system tetratricopeptide repeat protein [Dactylosporangium siamense]|uniref:FxSxx-COOH system tetratricopeptide repeat protein n=1 Tax=Dactylosporangium siamense TaxID=685454 RepID=UPI001945386C|nr:FxSxx-COOH system tetratricopeptide repeat protein [Dactylosporangium siamense]
MSAPIIGGLPVRSRNFTGRHAVLARMEDALRIGSRASILPHTLHGMGGVGKTQVVVEYVYRHLDEYDIVWWIPAEQTATVLHSLGELAQRLGLPRSEDLQRDARTVLDALADEHLAWLLVYDNADDPAVLDQFIPSVGGHVLITSRNQDWASIGTAIEVDVLDRAESIELLHRRTRRNNGTNSFSAAEAGELAEKLGDLPLALEQAAAWLTATAMPVREYIELLDGRVDQLLSEGKPASYPLTVAAFVALAAERLRSDTPATAQLLELFAFLGSEPVAVSLLRSGQRPGLTEPLRSLLGELIPMNRAIRELNRYGLVKVDASQRIQVHGLIRRVMRDQMTPETSEATLRNVRLLLAAANPGDPDEIGDFARQAALGPHIEPADLINADDMHARQVVLDHIRYLFLIGDYENSRYLAQRTAQAWSADARLGPDDPLTLRAQARLAEARRALGDSSAAAELTIDIFNRMRDSPTLGPGHEFTLITGIQIGHDLRISGLYHEALRFDRESVERFVEVFGPRDQYTLRAMAGLATDHRLVGDFAEALRIDQEIADARADMGSAGWRTLVAQLQVARDLLDLGAYQDGLDLVERGLPTLQNTLAPRHGAVLAARCLRGVLLRKTGQSAAAFDSLRETSALTTQRFGPYHEYTLAAQVSLANALRQLGDVNVAGEQIGEAVDLYRSHYGTRHPLTLIAEVNEAVIYRAAGDPDQARAIDERCRGDLDLVLGPDHPVTLCAAAAVATDLALAGEHAAARQLSETAFDRFRMVMGGGHEARAGGEHPDVLRFRVNLAKDLGDTEPAARLMANSLDGLRRALGPFHPDVAAAERGDRLEIDLEPPTT